MVDYHALKSWDFGDIAHGYTQRDTMLYALGIGMGQDPLDPGQLRFVYEKALQVMPTMAMTFGTPGTWWRDPRTGVDWVRVLLGEQEVRVFRPLPASGVVVGRNRVLALVDRGEGKGALAQLGRDICDQATGELIAQTRRVEILRGDGGFGQGSGQADAAVTLLPPISMDAGAPDIEVEMSVAPQAALIYRLSGDYNPLHCDPEVAQTSGLQRPLLHGLATMGIAAHAIVRICCDYQASRLVYFGVRFSSPVFPGDTIRFEIWRTGDRTVRLRAKVDARDVTVLDNGIAELA
jgi:acyl dehydratase